MSYHFLILSFLFLIFFQVNIFAQESNGRMETDRPDQTESPVTVSVKVLQVETGFTYESFIEDNIHTKNYSIAGTLIRYGLADNLELRFESGYSIHKADQTSYDFDNLLAGVKINFLNEEASLISLGLLANILPLSYPELIIAISKSIYDKLSVSVNFGGSRAIYPKVIGYIYTTSVEYSFTNKLDGFIEVYGNAASSFSPDNKYDGGLTYLLNDNLQLDASGGRKFSGNDSYWFVGTGVSFRTK
jgi:Putative MetA-pathway of phenol degradation